MLLLKVLFHEFKSLRYVGLAIVLAEGKLESIDIIEKFYMGHLSTEQGQKFQAAFQREQILYTPNVIGNIELVQEALALIQHSPTQRILAISYYGE